MTIRWELFEVLAARLTRYFGDEDAARDAALHALEELGDKAAGMPLNRVLRRAAWRLQDNAKGAEGAQEVPLDEAHWVPAEGVDPEAAAIAAEQLARLRSVDPAVIMRAFGYSYEEIASRTGVPVGAARVRVARARERAKGETE